MRTNTLKQKLKEGKSVFGAMLTFPSPTSVEMLGYFHGNVGTFIQSGGEAYLKAMRKAAGY